MSEPSCEAVYSCLCINIPGVAMWACYVVV